MTFCHWRDVMERRRFLTGSALAAFGAGFGSVPLDLVSPFASAWAQGAGGTPKPPTARTIAENQKYLLLPFGNTTDFKDAQRRLHGRLARRRDRPRRQGRVRREEILNSARRAAARHHEPESVAHHQAQRPLRPLQGRRRPLPGAQHRRRQHDDHGGQDRPHRHRLHDVRDRRQCRARALLPAPAEEAGQGGHPHP